MTLYYAIQVNTFLKKLPPVQPSIELVQYSSVNQT